MDNQLTALLSSKKPTCFAHNHLNFAEYGLYTYLREVSSKNQPTFVYRFDDRAIAARFASERGCSKDTVNRLRRSLVKKGFIQWLEPLKKSGGKFAPRHGRILLHREWAELHPGECQNGALPPVSNSTVDQSQVANHQSQPDAHQSQMRPSPVSNSTVHQSQQRDINVITTNGIVQTKSPKGIALPLDFSKSSPSFGEHSESTTAFVPPVSTAIQANNSPVSRTRQVDVHATIEAFERVAAKLRPFAIPLEERWAIVIAQLSKREEVSLVENVAGYYREIHGVSHARSGADEFALNFDRLRNEYIAKIERIGQTGPSIIQEAA